MANNQRKYKRALFKDIPKGTVFRVVKEEGRSPNETAKGMFVKDHEDGRASSYSQARQIILGLRDLVEILAWPGQRPQVD